MKFRFGEWLLLEKTPRVDHVKDEQASHLHTPSPCTPSSPSRPPWSFAVAETRAIRGSLFQVSKAKSDPNEVLRLFTPVHMRHLWFFSLFPPPHSPLPLHRWVFFNPPRSSEPLVSSWSVCLLPFPYLALSTFSAASSGDSLSSRL